PQTPRPPLFPYTTLFRSLGCQAGGNAAGFLESLRICSSGPSPDRGALPMGGCYRPVRAALCATAESFQRSEPHGRPESSDPSAEIGRHTSELQSPCNLVC